MSWPTASCNRPRPRVDSAPGGAGSLPAGHGLRTLERMPVVALAWLAGTLCVQALPALPSTAVLLTLAGLGAAALIDARTRALAVGVAAFVWTALYAQARLDDRLAPELAGADVAVTGWVDAFPDARPGRTIFSFRTSPERPAGVPRRLRLSWYDLERRLEPGDALDLTVRLREPRGLANRHAFDYERWLLVEGYGATGYVRSGAVDARAPAALARSWLELRAGIAARIDAAIASREAAALVTALAIGERGGFTDAEWRTLRRTGTSHLVAISGLHVGLVTALVFLVLRRLALRLPYRIAAHDLAIAGSGSVAAALAYAALAGLALPTQRAVIMALVAVVLVVSRRRVGVLDGFSVALVAVLAADPLAPLTASFWLSFGAVGVLLLIAARRPARTHASRRRGRLAELVELQWRLGIGMIPFTAAFFGEVSVLSPVINLLAIPVFCFALVPLALLAIVLLGVPAAAAPVLALAGLIAERVWAGLALAASAPWAAVTVPLVGPLALGAAVAAVAVVLPRHGLPGRHLAWIGLAPLLFPAEARLAHGTAAVSVFDVGHGLAVAVETADYRLLYDAGPRYASGFDTGREIVVPALERGRRAPLDTLVVGHADVDHAGGVPAVLEAFPAVRVVHGPDAAAFGGAACRAGQRWVRDGVAFEILHPRTGFVPLGNESSCVLKVTAGSHVLLITGDIESRAERVLAAVPAVGADVVVVPHHGSATSSSAAFVAATAPELAIVSAGHANRWGFPRPEVRRRWAEAGAALVVTGDVGQIRFVLGAGNRLELHVQRERRRYWRAGAAPVPGA